jgi:16S rRNA (uracil1498-N3)-methyltransferase
MAIEEASEDFVAGRIVETSAISTESPVAITLAQGLPKGRKFELIIQKAVELGVERIVPLAMARTVVRLEGKRASEKLERWRRIAREAAKQCRRTFLPEVEPLSGLEAFLEALGPPRPAQMRLLLWEEASEPLRELLSRSGSPEAIICIVGPEGGIEPEEASLATRAGFAPASLGPRILRTETAPLALLAILQHTFGDL